MTKSPTISALKPEELVAIVLGAITVIGCWAMAADTPAWPPLWAVVTWTVMLTAAINLGIIFESGDANFAGIIILSALLALGTGPAALITLIGVLAGDAVRALLPRLFDYQRRSWRTSLINGSANISMHGLSLLVGAALYRLLGGPESIVTPVSGRWVSIDFARVLGPTIGLLAGYFITNYVIFGLYLRLEGNSVRAYVRRHWRAVAALEVAPSVFAPLLASTYLNVPPRIFAALNAFMLLVMIITHNLSRARARLQQRVTELNSLSAVGEAVANSLELPEVLDAIYRQTRQLMDARYFYIALYQADEHTLIFPLAYEDGVRVRYDSRRFGAGITEHVITLKRPVLIRRDVSGYIQRLGLVSSGPMAQSWLGVPIVFGDDVLGAIGVQNLEKPDQYTDANQAILVAIAAQAATAIHNAQMYLAARHHTTQLALLNSVSVALNSTLELARVLDIIVTSVGRVMGNQQAAIFLLTDDGQHLSLAASHNLSAKYVEQAAQLPLDGQGRTRVVAARRPLIVTDVSTRTDLGDLQSVAADEGFSALAEVPLYTHAQIIGTLAIYYAEPHRFTQSEIDLLHTLANQAASAVTNAQLYARTDEALSRRMDQLAALEHIGRELTSSLNVDHVIQYVLDQAMMSTGATYGAIGLWQPDRQITRLTAARGYAPADEDRVRHIDWPVETGLVGRAIRTGQAICANDVSLDPDYVPTLPGVRSELIVPIKHEPNILGVINLESTRPYCFDQPAVDFVSQLATQAAIALQNAQLFASTVQARDELRAILDSARDGILMFDTAHRIVMANPRLEELLAVSAAELTGRSMLDLLERADLKLAQKLGCTADAPPAQLAQLCGEQDGISKVSYVLPNGHHRFVERTSIAVRDGTGGILGWMIMLRDATEERNLQQVREDLTNTIVHDLRSPLTSILGSLYLLQEMIPPGDADASQAVNISVRSTLRLLDLVNSLLDINKLQSGHDIVRLKPASLAAPLATAVERLTALANESGIRIGQEIAPELPLVMMDEDIIGRVIINLLDNALKFTPRNGRVTLVVEPDPDDDRFVRCLVRDTGPGIPPEHRTRIFNRFVQIDDQPVHRRGSGLGLSFCQLAVEAHGGRIWADAAPGGGGELVFTLQRASD